MPKPQIRTESVELILVNAPEPWAVFVEQSDGDHANPQKARIELGKPEYFSTYEIDLLKAASESTQEPLEWKYDQGNIKFNLSLHPQSVAAVTLELGMPNVISEVNVDKEK